MRALVFTAPNTVQLQDVDQPTVDEDEVIIDVRAVGICGSELHGIRDTTFRKPPLIMGHEFAGIDPQGRRVTVNPMLSCQACDRCRDGDDHLCRDRQILGIHRPGAFAEQLAVPADAVHVLPDSVSFEQAALIEPLANAVHAVRLAAPKDGARIAVIGAGAIGLSCLLVARQFSEHVDICDLASERLSVARQLGARTASTTLGGEYDLIIDAVGGTETHRMSLDNLRPGGTTVWVGLLSADAGFDAQHIVRFEKRVIGSYCYRRADFSEAVRIAEQVDLSWADTFEFDQAKTIFNELMNGRQDIIKALLLPSVTESAKRSSHE